GPELPLSRWHSADWARSHLWLLTIDEGDRAQHARSVGKADGESDRLTDDATGEGGGVGDPAIHRIRVDIVSPRRLEPPVGVGPDRSDSVAQGAADVHMDVGLGDDEPGVLTAPGSGDLGDRSRGGGGAGEER